MVGDISIYHSNFVVTQPLLYIMIVRYVREKKGGGRSKLSRDQYPFVDIGHVYQKILIKFDMVACIDLL